MLCNSHGLLVPFEFKWVIKKNIAVFNCAAYSVNLGALLQTALYKSDQLSAKKTRSLPDTTPPPHTHTRFFFKNCAHFYNCLMT